MIENQHTDSTYDRGARLGGSIALGLYVVLLALVLAFTRCDTSPEMEEELLTQGSILISFGDGEEGSGEAQKQEVQPVVESPPTPEPEPVEEEILTDEASTEEVEIPEQEQPEEVVAPVREVNKRALFPGSKSNGGESSGESEKAKEQSVAGSQKGSTEARSTLLGGGLSGDFDLAGRTLMGRLPVPKYSEQEEGRVVVDIVVDESGRVTSVSPNVGRSTTNSLKLIEAAMEAARQARFSTSESFIQSGTITYIFTLN